MQFGKVEICGVNTAKLKVLTENEKLELIKLARNGDAESREKLIVGNLRLILSIIQRFANRGENPDDLFQVGCIGLIKAIDNFDFSYNVRFSSYAVPMIIGELRRYLRDNTSMRVSRSMRDTAFKAMQAKEALLGELHREPSIEEISERLELEKETVVLALEAIAQPVSLYEPVYESGGDTIYVMDQVSEPEGEDGWLGEIVFKQAVGDLSDREKQILSMRFLCGQTQMEVAGEIGISQAQVSRLEKGAIGKIKYMLFEA